MSGCLRSQTYADRLTQLDPSQHWYARGGKVVSRYVEILVARNEVQWLDQDDTAASPQGVRRTVQLPGHCSVEAIIAVASALQRMEDARRPFGCARCKCTSSAPRFATAAAVAAHQRQIHGPLTATRTCAGCEQLGAEDGDIYCQGCREGRDDRAWHSDHVDPKDLA